MDMDSTNNAIMVCGMPKEIVDKIWKKERKPFEVYK
jgi:hypothetical protein